MINPNLVSGCISLVLCTYIVWTSFKPFFRSPSVTSSRYGSDFSSNRTPGNQFNAYKNESALNREPGGTPLEMFLVLTRNLEEEEKSKFLMSLVNKSLHAWLTQFRKIPDRLAIRKTDYPKFSQQHNFENMQSHSLNRFPRNGPVDCVSLDTSEMTERDKNMTKHWNIKYKEYLTRETHTKMFIKTDYISRLEESTRIVETLLFTVLSKPKPSTFDSCSLHGTIRRLSIIRTLILATISALPWNPADILNSNVSADRLIGLWFARQGRHLFDVPCLKCYRKVRGTCMKLFFCGSRNNGSIRLPSSFKFPRG